MIVYSRPLQKFLTLVFVLILGLSLTMSILKPISGVFASNSVLPHAQGVTPFLYPPYPGAVSENSIFDHHMPTYTIQDRTIVTYTGHQAIGTQGDPNCDGIPPDNNNCVKEYNSASLGYLLSYDGHPGIDYGAEYIPIFASADSNQVAFAGWWNPANHRENLGLHVRLHHPNNYETLYGHLSAISVGTCSAPGCASIPHGSIIGISGNTGSSSGPHLHFEIQNPNGFRVDPYGWDLNRTDLPDRDLQDDPAPEANRSTNLWVDYPEISNTQTVLYRGEGNPLTFPLYPDGGILVDDDAYLRDQNGQVPPGSSPDFTADACWTIPNEDPLLDPEVEPFHFAINQYKLRASATTNTQNPCLARWYLPDDQQSGKYAIYIHIPHSTNSLANSVVYRVYSGGAEIAKLVINQREIETFLDTATNSQDLTVNRAWIYVGTYYFVQNAANFISISNVTDGPTKDANGNNIPDTIILE